MGDKQWIGMDPTRCRYGPPTTLMLPCGRDCRRRGLLLNGMNAEPSCSGLADLNAHFQYTDAC